MELEKLEDLIGQFQMKLAAFKHLAFGDHAIGSQGKHSFATSR